MIDNDIINFYKKGFSIDFISKRYYDYKNKNIEKPKYIGNDLLITKKKIKKDEARLYVTKVIYDYVYKLFKDN